ncbi:hypothetical protein OH76DRAFT_1343716 [Lentinus brumalis]|uniref:Uncharacterized protein n=1 Tax=Lentinus brumalis TaxID=2498619 RepID=A0A371DKI2_9APHY|nr:hypothetical protein OH76DRAFT_1343716 [Polyporus brumalis]
MDHDELTQVGVDAERMRMTAFSFGKPVSPTGITHSAPPRHSRSHSRNSSVSVPISLPTPVSTSMNDSPPHSPTRSSISGAKRNSHHRRRSSVSTRRESADLMGVSLPSIPLSSSEDNINLGDKDSIRRRALMALEGRDAGGSFSVEIPELDAPKRSFDFPSKPSFPPGMGAGFSAGLMGSKRDSVAKYMASSPSAELATLVEEEEEEEEDIKAVTSPVQESPVTPPATITIMSPSPAPARPRPATLNLRPLSLTLSSPVQVPDGELPTPSLTPSPRPGLKSLTLASSQSANSGFSSNMANKRQSLILTSSPAPSFGRRPSLNLMTDNTVAPPQPNRRSSIGYVSEGQTMSVCGLPTPEMTPTSSSIDRRRSTSVSSSNSMDLNQLGMQRGRPLSMTEQHFLFQAHETLVQRITDLERALSRQSRSSRPVSCASDTSSSTPSEPSDEMLQLIADLKAERDELKRDVDGWRTRVADLQRQVDLHAKRVEAERRDAWVARQRVGLLEIEKASLQKTVAEKTALADDAQARYDAADRDLQTSQREFARLNAEVERMRGVEDEVALLRAELLQERQKREDMERELEHAGLLDTPRPYNATVRPAPIARAGIHAKGRGLGFRSIDSESSFTDVESVDDNHYPELKAVEEVDEDTDMTDDNEDDELARYEEEEDGDDDFQFTTSSSYESMMEYARSATPRLSTDSADSEDSAPSLVISRSASPLPSPLPSPSEPTHARHNSLSKAWSFPSGPAPVPAVQRPREEIDRFFGCLEDVDNSPPVDSKLHSVESNKSLFAQALADYDDDLPPFLLPSDVGEIVVSPEMVSPSRTLDIVIEEEEEDEEEAQEDDDSYDEFVGEVDEGGIRFTFKPPPSYFVDSDADMSTPDLSTTSMSTPESVSKTGYVFEPIDEDEDDCSFTFPQLKAQRSSASPSGIPRLRSPSPSSNPSTSTPPKIFSPLPLRIVTSHASFSTPPPRRAATVPTFIPQPRVSSASSSKVASFIPQPQRSATIPRPSAIPVMTPPASSRLPYNPRFSSMCVSNSPTRSAVYSRRTF